MLAWMAERWSMPRHWLDRSVRLLSDVGQCQRISAELRDYQDELEAQNLDLREMQQHLLDAKERYQDLYDFAPVGYVSVDARGVIIEANLTLARYLQKPRTQLKSLPFVSLLQPGEGGTFLDNLREAFISLRHTEIELTLKNGHDPARVVMLSMQCFKSSCLTDASCRMVVVDITGRKMAEKALIESRETLEQMVMARTCELRLTIDTLNREIRERTLAQQSLADSQDKMAYLAHHDPLTRLPNRALFSSRLEQSLQLARRSGTHVAILFLDLDRFKSINDTLGHSQGDELLTEVGRRLVACVRAGDTVARLGGDEFTVIMSELRHEEEAALVAEKILALITQPIRLGHSSVVISTSIGIGMFPRDADSDTGLIRCADLAMYNAKESGRNAYAFYSSDLACRAQQKLAIEQSIRNGLESNQFVLHYQPQIDISSGRLIGVEALLRWNNPAFGMLMPEQVISIAEETGLITQVDEWALRKALGQFSAWREEGLEPFCISVNCSGVNFLRPGYVERVRKALQEFQVPAEYFELELTESVFNRGAETIRELQRLRDLGIKLAIDDFGTGFSSLSSLKHLPVDRLKIDRSFIHDLPRSSSDSGITTAIITMGHQLDLRVIAEGVENDEQYVFLRDAGCDEVQGYCFGKPILPECMAEFVRQSAARLN
jgi:diguanylate cyclase (GGDEF)-like protein